MTDPIPVIPAPPENFRSGFVALIGRPNVGKSTLLNALVGQKIAITSPVAQTTRNRLRGILTLPTFQVILVDTPGIHKPHHLLGEVLVKSAIAAMESVDLVVFVVDGTEPLGRGDQFVAELLTQAQVPTLIAVNKTDLHPPSDTYGALAQANHWPLLSCSALAGTGVMELQQVMGDRLPPGPYYYPPDLVTDQPERFIMAELIREQILHLTREEVPHSVAVAIDLVEETAKHTRVMASINVERSSQKGIIIGKNGQMLKTIGTGAREQMQKLIMGKVYLELFVKVEPKWRSSPYLLNDLGYSLEPE
ncbi:MAG: GTPase Era [Oscillatoriales cyanobacterium SM2_2_1]|nr:GTPase Era [Oscillatoriales cyanobacterium SM2_2_1]